MMRADMKRYARAAGRGGRRDKGFTIVEVLIAMLITSIVALSVYSLYNTFFRQSNIQDMKVEAQQNARAALNLMEREMMNAGYASGTADIVTEATANSVEFIYTDPETDAAMSATAGKRLKVRYGLQTTAGVQYLVRKADNLTDSTVGSNEQMAQFVESFAATYYDVDGNLIADTSTQPNRNAIKFITLNLVTRTRSNIQGTTAPATFMLETHIRLRNIGVGATGNDSTAPSAPTGLQVRDPGQCGRLKVKWTKSTEGDLMGYKLYYGIATGSYEGVINVPKAILSGSTYSCTEAGSSIECTILPTSPALAYTPSDGSSTTVHYLALKAYDNSLNHSDFSSEVSGNPGTSNSVFDSGVDDSTLNPVKPQAVAGFTSADGASDGQVALSWSSYDTSANPDVTGFRIYRSTSAFSSYPIDPAQPGIDWIAGEPGSGRPGTVDQSAASYTDSGPGLMGCRVYYYAIAPVKCDSTLMPDNGGDPNDKKYIKADYDATCGDGTNACTAGTGFASVAGSDTAPDKTTAPGSPTIDARAGWKRVALSLTQPADTDLDQTCVYVNESSSYPSLLTDTGSYPKVSGCYQVNLTSTPDAQLVPDSGGVFTSSELSPAQSASFWHDSMAQESPASPSLADTGTYSYRAVSFDLCGNGSNIAGAQATTVLCGEDPATGEKPPAVTALSVSACAGPATLSWTPVPSDTASPSSPTNPYDLAGYRIFRSTSADFSGSTLISGSAPFWGASYSDNTLTEGGTYYYRIVSTDCPYERENPSEATLRSDMISGYLNSVIVGPVRPGRIDRDEKCVGAGSCTKDDHREVLTGVSLDNSSGTGTGASSVGSALRHHTVTMMLNNTSSGTMTIKGASVSWVNSSANLREVKIGGGRGGVGTTSTSLAAGLTTAVSGNPPYNRAVSNATLTSTAIPAGARYVPIVFTFKDASDNEVDMRDDQLLVTLNVTNDSTGTSSCSSYMTVSLSPEGIYVPFGPSVTAAQQNKPASPTFGYAVPGSTGLNTVPSGSDGSIVVGSNVAVTITASIAGNTTDASTGGKVAVASATLYYAATAKTTTTAPNSGYTSVAMTNTSGNTWSASIPTNDGQRVWYYMLAVDDDGNWDRDPEKDHGAYVYDQKNFNICDVTPSAPTGLSAVAVGANVTLSWSAVTTYTSGGAIDASDTIKYRIFKGGVQIGADQLGTSYSDNGLADGIYSYTVRALNACASTGPNVSADSSGASTCVGNNSQATLTVTPTSIYRGDNISVTVVDCLAMRSDSPYTYGTSIQTINGAEASFNGFNTSSTVPASYAPSFSETGVATGTFTTTIGTTGNVSESGKLLTLATDTVSVYYPFASPSTKTVSVVVDPCTNTPKAPTGFTGSASGQNMTVSWAAVTQNTDNSAIADLAGYRIYEKVCAKDKPNCTGADIVADWFLRTTVGAGTVSTTIGADQGNLNQRIYYFKVTAYDTCSTPKESAYSNVWNETN